MKNFDFRVWCNGTFQNANFNKKGWWDIDDYILNKYFPRFSVLCESEFFTVQQWSGLVDKNGVKIYKGDRVIGCTIFREESGEIALSEPLEGVVEFRYSTFIVVDAEGKYVNQLTMFHPSDDDQLMPETEIEVIGNIFDDET